MRLVERLPAFLVDAFDKQVGVEGGLADKSQHFAGLGVQRHQRAAAIAEHVFHQLLQLDVDRQHHRVARGGRAAGQLAHGAATGRGFHALDTGDAVQLAPRRLCSTPSLPMYSVPR